MTRIEVKGIHRVKRKLASGQVREHHYAWRGGPRFWASDSGVPKHGPAYWAAYKGAVEGAAIDQGTFSQIVRAFLQSRDFQRLAPRTQKDYAVSLHHQSGILAKFGNAPIAVFNRPEIRRIAYAWRDSFESPRVADSMKSHLVAIVNWGVDRAFIKANHLAGMSNLYKVDRSDIIWTDAEIDLFLHGDGTIPPAPVWLQRILIAATETGLRPDDLRVLARGHVHHTKDGRRIVMRTAKRKRMVSIPVTPRMAKVIDATPSGQIVLLCGGTGQPFAKSASLGQAVSRRRDQCHIRQELRLYDARGTAATRLFQADASIREIAMHMGWSIPHTARMIETYVSMNPEVADSLLIKLSAGKA